MSYNLTNWDAAAGRIHVDGQPVRLGGFHNQNSHTVDVIGLNGSRITLLVLPPHMPPTVARQVLMAAGQRGNIDGVDELLTPTAITEIRESQ